MTIIPATALLGCGSPTDLEPEATFFEFDSEPGEWVGSGRQGRVTVADGQWFARYFGGSDNPQRFEVVAPGWSMLFAAPDGETIDVGTYEEAQRSLGESKPALDIGSSRGCNVTSGRFEILFAELGDNGQLNKLRLRFTQYCEGSPLALRGELSVLANPWR